MKLIQWTVWILLAFVLSATLDSRPDPPAVNPSTTLCKVLQHDCACDTATQGLDLIAASSSFLVGLIADAYEPHRPSVRMILTVHAADPSPPARTMSFLS